ncbi:Na(+) H(+) antiporter subunit E [Rhodovulum sp. PH10]|uniref:Na+/H+ antiporter subunit E n=1 Tax=Rhodovulum sp. PH10 TaxID=1187851 RepID=UPI00027C27BA|nr:Na+/H+ antiporter subunit E [Rhodovulum sp. PH10]EJW11800.1 Na(+) H(+) antiporter subunit E [Rhodovulum sp. PH10]
MARFLPHPVLTVVIALVWLALVNTVSAGHLLLGLALGVGIPWFTQDYWPGHPRLKRPLKIVEYGLVVAWDILVSNVQVAYLVLFRRGESLRSRFVSVPLDLRTPEAVTVLAGTITLTPGTVSADLAADGGAILVHCLEADDPDAVVAGIKQRYERRLKEIFE